MILPRNETRLCTRMQDVRYGWGPATKGSKTYVTCDSHVVPHRSTEQAQGCLTSEFGWDPVLSPWYERMMGSDRPGGTGADPGEGTPCPSNHNTDRASSIISRSYSGIGHTFSAFWLRSSVVSVLISLISDTMVIDHPVD